MWQRVKLKKEALTAVFALLLIGTLVQPKTNFYLSSYAFASERDTKSSKVAVVIGKALAYDIPLVQVRRLLEHQGLTYDVVKDGDLSRQRCEKYSAIIVVGISKPNLSSLDNLSRIVEDGTGLIWIGEGLPDSLYELFGIREVSMGENELEGIKRIDYGTVSAKVFNETLYGVEPSGAFAEGFFVDQANRKIAPAELSYRKNNASGLTYYFAYDVYSWWGADLDVPWLRAYRLQIALDRLLSEHLIVRLAPYPRNLRSVFITRIEDVDPLHTSPEWLTRADNYLEYYSARNVPLTVSLTPTYIEPSKRLRVDLGADSADALRRWLSDVVIRGGSLVEHGSTHQYGGKKTGVAPEFFDEEEGKWLTLDEQMHRISHGASQIYSNLGFSVKGFESPHYLANHDTYIALRSLGFKYVTHNSDTPFFDRYGLAERLVNIPETLGFIPLNASEDMQEKMCFNMDMLYNMSGVMLFFNHLFEDEALQIGERLLNHALKKQSVWYTNTDNLADFWHERLNAYSRMNISVEVDERIKVVLGSSRKAGLTLVLNEGKEIRSVKVNGNPWPVFDKNYVILPVLPEQSNEVIIDLSETEANSNLPYGALTIALSTIFSALLYRAIRGRKTLEKSDRSEKVYG